MKKIFISILAVAAMTFAACNKEQHIDEPVQDVVENNYPVLKAVIDSETKMAFDGTQLSFQVGDLISVFNGIVTETVTDETTGEETVTETGDRHGHTLYECTAVEDGVATFEWIESNAYKPAPEVDIVATYPNRGVSTSAFEPEGEAYGEGTVKIRMVATADKAFDARSLPVIASATKGQMLQFKHTAGLLELNLKGTQTIEKVAITSDKIISGDASVRYADEEPVLNVVGAGTSNDYTITYTYLEPVVLSEEGVKLYFGLPVGTHDLTFTFSDSEGKKMVKSAKGLKMERAKITPTSLPFVVTPPVDLTAGNAYSNCFMIQKAGDYSFDAVKPDGNAVTGVSAAWIWAAGNDCTTAGKLPATMMSDIKYENGKVYFSVPHRYTGGNVVVGLVNAENALEYTWHVWLTASGVEDVTVSGVAVMDRNLGAICKYDVTTETVLSNMQYGRGNYYQWGRKDPILGSRNAGGNADLTTSGGNNQSYVINTGAKISNVSAWEIAETAGATTEAAAAKPLVFVSTNTGVANYDANDKSTPWCSRPNANPCPYGYRVMNDEEFAAIIANPITYAACPTSANMRQYSVAGLTFPLSGNRGTDGKQANLSEARYFSDNVDSSAANKGRNCKFTGTNTAKATQSSYGANTASSVRCVRVTK